MAVFLTCDPANLTFKRDVAECTSWIQIDESQMSQEDPIVLEQLGSLELLLYGIAFVAMWASGFKAGNTR